MWANGGRRTFRAGTSVAVADTYAGHPIALQLGAMNVIYEIARERGATMPMPSLMADSLNAPSAAMVALAGPPHSATVAPASFGITEFS